MAKYSTKQRAVLLDFLACHADETFSSAEIANALSDKQISVSAVYRNLSTLEEENKVRRVSKAGSREIFYQFTDSEECRGEIHLSCRKCGKTFHMDHPTAESLIHNVAQNDRFTLDVNETVLYGICTDCKNGAKI